MAATIRTCCEVPRKCSYKTGTQILVLAVLPFSHLYILAVENMRKMVDGKKL